jgi:predicted dehydrogenase
MHDSTVGALATAAVAPALVAPRLGFFGVGLTGRQRLEALTLDGTARIAAVADDSPDAAREAARMAPGARVVRSFQELLAGDLDGLVIATTNAVTAAHAQAALAHELALFCQRPLGRTAAEVEAVVAAARRTDRLLASDLSLRLTRAGQALREVVASGTLGEVYAVNLVFHSAHGPDKPWFYDRALAGGGCLMDLGAQLLDLALWCLDWPRVDLVRARLCAGGRPLAAQPEAIEDYASAQLTVASGAVLQLACSWHTSLGCDAVVEASFFGTRGGAVLRNVNGAIDDFTCLRTAGTQREPLVAPPDHGTGRAVVHWAQRLARGERFDPEASRLVQVAQVIDRLYAAA